MAPSRTTSPDGPKAQTHGQLTSANWRTRLSAVEALAGADAGQTPLLAQALDDPCATVRVSAVRSLQTHSGATALASLLAACKDSVASVRRAAAEALSERDGSESASALIALLSDTEPKVREAAATSLGLNTDPRSARAVGGCFSDADEDVRLAAAMALGRMGAGAMPGLKCLMAQTQSAAYTDDRRLRVWARMTAVILLRALGSGEAALVLKPALEDADPDVRAAAAEALKSISGE